MHGSGLSAALACSALAPAVRVHVGLRTAREPELRPELRDESGDAGRARDRVHRGKVVGAVRRPAPAPTNPSQPIPSQPNLSNQRLVRPSRGGMHVVHSDKPKLSILKLSRGLAAVSPTPTPPGTRPLRRAMTGSTATTPMATAPTGGSSLTRSASSCARRAPPASSCRRTRSLRPGRRWCRRCCCS